MAGLTHAAQVTDGVGLFRVGEVPEWNYMVNRYGRADVLETYDTSATVPQDSQRASINPTPSSVGFHTTNIEVGQYATPSFGDEFVGTYSVAEPPHFIPSGMLPRFPWRSFKVLGAIRACVLNVIDKPPSLSWSNLSFIWTRKSKSMLVPDRMGTVVNTVFGGPLTMTRLTAKSRLGQTIVRYRILNPTLNTVLDWHVAKIVNKRHTEGRCPVP